MQLSPLLFSSTVLLHSTRHWYSDSHMKAKHTHTVIKQGHAGTAPYRRSVGQPGSSLATSSTRFHDGLLFGLILIPLLVAATSCSPEATVPESTVAEATADGGADVHTGAEAGGEPVHGASSSAAPHIHPEFDLTADELEELLSEEPEAVRSAVRARPEYFLELVDRTLDLPKALYALVDKTHPLPENYRPSELVALSVYSRIRINRDSLQLSSLCIPDLLAMNEAARADGVTLVISSAFRSYSYQKGLYEGYVAKHGQEEADRFSARPGTSQHQLGTAIDFGSITEKIASTPQGEWLAEHAWEYGFSLSYPKGMEETTGYMWEPWHFRYMSRTATRLEREFFGGVQQHMTEFLHRRTSELRAAGL